MGTFGLFPQMSPFEPCGSGAAKAKSLMSLTGVLMKSGGVKQERLLSSLKSSSSLPRVSVVQ